MVSMVLTRENCKTIYLEHYVVQSVDVHHAVRSYVPLVRSAWDKKYDQLYWILSR